MNHRNTFLSRGFTFIELLLVFAILAALASMMYLRFNGAQNAARDSRRKSDVRQYQNALEVYANSHSGLYPITNPLTTNAISLCGSSNPLGAIPCTDDPVTTQHYRYNTNGSGTSYVLYATLEKPNPVQVYYTCSNGFAGTAAASGFNPNNGVCP